MLRSLWQKLLVLFLAVFFCSVCGLTYFTYTSTREAMLQEFNLRGRELVKAIAVESRTYYEENNVEGFTTLLQSLGEAEGVVAILAYDAAERLWVESSIIELLPKEIILKTGGQVWQQEKILAKGSFVSEFGRMVVNDSTQVELTDRGTFEPVGWLRIFLDRQPLEERLGALIARTVSISLVTLMLGVGVFVLLLRQSLRVIGPLIEATQKVALGDLGASVPIVCRDELGQLAPHFNQMTENLHKTTVSKQYVDNIINSMMNTLIVVNPNGTIRSVNQATLHLLGYKETELVGRPVSMIFPKGGNPFKEEFGKGFPSHNVSFKAETNYLGKTGQAIPMLFSAAVMRNDEGTLQGIACVVQDITDRKVAEERLRLEGAALESAANAVAITDRTGKVTWVNPAFSRLTGYSMDEILGENMRILKSNQQDHFFYKALWDTIVSGKVWRGELINRRKDGTLYTEEQTITPVYNEGGDISHFVWIKQDVTERKKAEEALQSANLKLQELDNLRSQFFADISHELRTPLTVIRGEAEVTLRGKKKSLQEYKTALSRIVELTNQVNKLVNDLLFLARSESGPIQIETQPTSLSEILMDVHRAGEVLAKSKTITVTLSHQDNNNVVQGDPQRLRQLFMILLDNAVNYTDPGGAINVNLIKEAGYGKVTVADNGIGIPADDLTHVFERFYRVKRSGNQFHVGVGLGLPIAKWISEAHQGNISLVSTQGAGTVVTVRLPLSKAARV